MKTEPNKYISQMRKGKIIKCPKCEKGLFSAVGDPLTTKIFKCDTCPASIILTIPYKKENI